MVDALLAERVTNSRPPMYRMASLKILLVEDNPGDVRLIREMLAEGSRNIMFRIDHADSLAAGSTKLKKDTFDAVLLDLGLPDSRGLDTFYSLHSVAPSVPIIILTVLHDEEAAIQAVRSGAQDYIVKGRIESDLLTRGILYSIERKHTEKTLSSRTVEAETALAKAATYFDFLAHDIANIMSPVMAYAELIAADDLAGSGARTKAAKIVGQARRASSFILSLRILEMAEKCSPDEFDVVDIPSIFAEAEARIGLEYPEKNLKVSYEMSADPRMILVGGRYLENIIKGIFETAANYSNSDVISIHVAAKTMEDANTGPFLRLEVADEGAGIPDDMKSSFLVSSDTFERFKRGTARGVASSLLVYSALAKHFGGKMWIEDRVPGDYTKGAKVVMMLRRGG